MGRLTTVSYTEISNIAESIYKSGESLTLKAVRRKIARGSDTTVNRFLSQWKKENISSKMNEDQGLLEAVKSLKDRANEDASKRIAEMKTVYDQQIQKYSGLIESLKKDIEEKSVFKTTLEGLLDDNNNKVIKLSEDNEILGFRLREAHDERVELIHSLSAKSEIIDKLEKQLEKNQSNLEHYWESTKASREVEKNSYESEIFTLRQKLVEVGQRHDREIDRNLKDISDLNNTIEVLRRENSDFVKNYIQQRAEIDKLDYITKNQDMVIRDKDEIINALKKIVHEVEFKNKELKQDNLFLIKERNGIFKEDK